VKQLRDIMDKQMLPWRSFVDAGNAGAGPIATRWNLSATPTFYVIDHQGVIRHKWAGPPGEKILDAALDKLIKAAEGDGKAPRVNECSKLGLVQDRRDAGPTDRRCSA
jgi:hypothetical protein